MRQRRVRIQSLVVEEMQYVYSVRSHLAFDTVEVVPYCYGFEFAAKLSGKRFTFCQKFEADVEHSTVFYFAVYK